MFWVGFSIGVLVGIITGVITLITIKPFATSSISDPAKILPLTRSLRRLLAWVIGANFLLTGAFFLENDEIKTMMAPYFVALVAIFLIIVLYPLYRWIENLGRQLGESKG